MAENLNIKVDMIIGNLSSTQNCIYICNISMADYINKTYIPNNISK